HRSPMEIATELEAFIAKEGPRPAGPSPRAAGANSRPAGLRNAPPPAINTSSPGFLNFTLAGENLREGLEKLRENFDEEIKDDTYAGKLVICEFSDPNPFKVLHVGHLYTSVVGDSISRLFEYAGAKVVRANFGGDVGLHVAKTMYALMQEDTEHLEIETIAKCYVKGTQSYEEDEKAREEITRLNKEIYKINAEDLHDSDLAQLYWKGRELSYEYFEKFYASIGLKFDKYYPESTVAALGLSTVKKQLAAGVYEESNGAVIFDGEKFGLHTRVFINKEGVPTYEAKDVGLIFTKWEDYHFDKSVVITGNEQLDYMRVVLKSVEQYAPELVERTSHLTHGLVKLPGNEKMSSRKGNFLRAVDVLDMVREALKTEYNSEDEKISLAATKYAFIKYKMGGNIIFDVGESVKMTGNSGPYLLYSAVRAKKILQAAVDASHSGPRPAGPSPRAAGANSRAAALRNAPSESISPAERNLAVELLKYKGVLSGAVGEMAPHKVATYLYELAQEFSRFYENCPVVGSENEAERVGLVKVYLDVMTHGLNILGMEIPEEM
ncbi:arginine--tRNA ligase, partial [Candidatus Saccharibacteria bacterium]|nr:arginine--tRNA ligase [Candidatus Saccharibacteria bacterium]